MLRERKAKRQKEMKMTCPIYNCLCILKYSCFILELLLKYTDL